MKKKVRLTEKHALHKKVCEVFDLMDKLEVQFHIVRNGEILVVDKKTREEFFLMDLEENNSIDNRSPYDIPPTFDWKLSGEMEVKDE